MASAQQTPLFSPEDDAGELYAMFRAARLAHRMTFEQALASPSLARALAIAVRNQALAKARR